jgi:hypothetical protein
MYLVTKASWEVLSWRQQMEKAKRAMTLDYALILAEAMSSEERPGYVGVSDPSMVWKVAENGNTYEMVARARRGVAFWVDDMYKDLGPCR